MQRRAALLGCLLLCSGPAWADTGVLAGVAEKLPLSLVGLDTPTPPKRLMQDLPPPAPAANPAPLCAVRNEDLPPDFIRLMSRLEEPVGTKAAPEPMPAASQDLPRYTPRPDNSATQVQMFYGNAPTRSKTAPQRNPAPSSGGVKIYRGGE